MVEVHGKTGRFPCGGPIYTSIIPQASSTTLNASSCCTTWGFHPQLQCPFSAIVFPPAWQYKWLSQPQIHRTVKCPAVHSVNRRWHSDAHQLIQTLQNLTAQNYLLWELLDGKGFYLSVGHAKSLRRTLTIHEGPCANPRWMAANSKQTGTICASVRTTVEGNQQW